MRFTYNTFYGIFSLYISGKLKIIYLLNRGLPNKDPFRKKFQNQQFPPSLHLFTTVRHVTQINASTNCTDLYN